MGAKKERLDKSEKELTPLQRMLRAVGLFKENSVSEDAVLAVAEELAIASADPENAANIVRIDNGIERLAGIAVQGSESFKANFIDALERGGKVVAEKGGVVTPHVAEVISVLRPSIAA